MIEVEGLVKEYGAFRAVDEVSFRVRPGEIVGFLGPNGAGKTTTLRVLAGYHAADRGRARVAGFDVLEDSLQARRSLGYLPEQVPIYPDMRVEEYLRFRAALKGVPKKARRTRVHEAMEIAGVVEMRRKLVGQVSRGYRQRVGLADALVGDPPALILDEPTSGLDPNQRRKVRESIRSLAGVRTILFSSHILSDVEAVCDRILLIHRGRILADGALDSLVRESGRTRIRVRVRAGKEEAQGLCAGIPLGGPPLLEEEGDGFLSLDLPLEEGAGSEGDRWLDLLSSRIREAGLSLRELRLDEPDLEGLFHQLTKEKA